MKILVVDDEELMLKALKFRLSKDGYEVDMAMDEKNALRKLKLYNYDLVITDVVLSFNNGLEIVNYVKKESGKNTPVMMLSSVGAETQVLEGFALGADDYMTKPFSPVQLSARVKRFAR